MISAGLGVAIAAQRENSGRKTICVIGDGAITAGMAFEAMNHSGALHTDMLVILNDNDMSISECRRVEQSSPRLLSGSFYSSLREGGKKILSGLPPIKEFVKKRKSTSKFVSPGGTLF